jgi:hypothetical protein
MAFSQFYTKISSDRLSKMIIFFLLFASSRRPESLLEKYKNQLNISSSQADEEEVILCALSDLAYQVDKSVTTDEVKSEISSKISEILENVENADSVLRHDFESLRTEFVETKAAVADFVQCAKGQIREELQQFKLRLIDSLYKVAADSSEAHHRWFGESSDKFADAFELVQTREFWMAVGFFLLLQVLIVIAVGFRRKLDDRLRSLQRDGGRENEQVV